MAPRTIVVAGGGQAGFQAAVSLREGGCTDRIVLIAGEGVLPYQRPPLSKSYLTGTGSIDEVVLRPEPFYAAHGIELATGDRVIGIEPERHEVVLASGRRMRTIQYHRLILATGSRPRPLPVPGAELDGVLTLRGLADADTLRARLGSARDLLIVGAGFIGLEIAAAARKRGVDVTVVEALPHAMSRAASLEVSDFLTEEHRRQGVHVLLGREVTALCGDAAGHVQIAELNNGLRLPADLVVVGIGVLPDFSLAAAAGLSVGDGVIVDEYLRTSDPAIYAIGDCARFPSPHADRHVRLESVQNAVDQARCVAAGICGRPEPYTDVPWFWSDQYAVKLQIAGITAGHDRTVVMGSVCEGRFSVLCFRQGRLIGVESVNKPADHIMARRLLAARVDVRPEDATRPGFDLKSQLHQPA